MKRKIIVVIIAMIALVTKANLPEEMTRDYGFFNIILHKSGEEVQTVNDIVNYSKVTGCKLVLPAMAFHPVEKDPRVRARKLLGAYRRLRSAIGNRDIDLGVLVQSMMGHWADPNAVECPWTRSIDISGKPWRFCPLDKDFIEYVEWFIGELAKENPAFIMTDDDMLCKGGRECFCPLHLKEANRRLNANMTEAEYRQRVKQAREGNKAYSEEKRVFEELAIEMTTQLAAIVRKAIDKVNPNIPSGICVGAPIYFKAAECARAIASTNQPTLARLSTSCYRERSVKDFPRYMLATFQQECVSRGIDIRLDESDTFPHNLWSVSKVTFKAKLALAAISGLNGSKIWYVGMHKYGRAVPKEYLEAVAEMAPICRALAREVRGTKQLGFAVISHMNDISAPSLSSYQTWGDRFGGVFGVPWRCESSFDGEGIYTLSDAEDVKRCKDEDIKKLLSGKLLLDGRAAAELSRRGYSHLMGVTALSRSTTNKVSGKIDTAYDIVNITEFVNATSNRVGHLRTPDSPILQDVQKGAKIYSSLKKKGGEEPLAVYFENSLGGKILTTALDIGLESREPWSRRGFDPERKEWFLGVLDLLSSSRTPYAVLNEKNMAVIAKEKPDGKHLVAVWNIHHDGVEKLFLTVASKPAQIEVLNKEGNWVKAVWSMADGAVKIDVQMPCYGFEVFRFSY
ncbi:MAG: hypothetical protein J6S51_01730 [Kiritimatiellae bacterium]|nr:hypothetical protein [Kiritimatiellia bacterium]